MDNVHIYEALVDKFRKQYGHEPEVVAYAPGRIEVLGNHTDYNEGLVLSAAINYGTYFALSPSASSECRLTAGDIMEEVRFSPDAPGRSDSAVWSNYVRGVWAGILEKGATPKAFDAMFFGNIPLGAGLSSSAALETASALAFETFAAMSIDRIDIAKIGQRAEHEYAGVKCGLLDQISSLFGKKDHLVESDFRSLEVKNVPLGADACFLMCNTNAKHALVDGAYNERREHCEQATSLFSGILDHPVNALRDVSVAEWEQHKAKLPEVTAKRSAHPVGETERVLTGAELLRKGDLTGFGELMFDSHQSSRTMFENSCEELDTIVDAAKALPGAMGARLSGGGFGGSVVVLVHPRDAETTTQALRQVYEKKYGVPCDVREIICSNGAMLIKG